MVLLCTINPSFHIKSLMHFCQIIIVKKNKTSINNADSHFQLFLTLFQNRRNKMHQNSISFSKQQQEISLITTLPFSSQCWHWCGDWEAFVKFAEKCWARNVQRYLSHILPPAPAAMVAISGYYVLLLRSWGGNADGIWNDVEKPSWRLEWWVHTRMGTTQPILPYFMKMQCVGSLQNAIWLIYSPTLSI